MTFLGSVLVQRRWGQAKKISWKAITCLKKWVTMALNISDKELKVSEIPKTKSLISDFLKNKKVWNSRKSLKKQKKSITHTSGSNTLRLGLIYSNISNWISLPSDPHTVILRISSSSILERFSWSTRLLIRIPQSLMGSLILVRF